MYYYPICKRSEAELVHHCRLFAEGKELARDRDLSPIIKVMNSGRLLAFVILKDGLEDMEARATHPMTRWSQAASWVQHAVDAMRAKDTPLGWDEHANICLDVCGARLTERFVISAIATCIRSGHWPDELGPPPGAAGAEVPQWLVAQAQHELGLALQLRSAREMRSLSFGLMGSSPA